LIGARPVILLDEPSTGIDPEARRRLWKLILEASSSPSRCVILTTQYDEAELCSGTAVSRLLCRNLEECEALCSRLSVMVDGVMQCIGTVSHLRHKFSDSLKLKLKVGSAAALASAEAFVTSKVAGARLAEQRDTHMLFFLPKATNSLADLYELLDREADAEGITEYEIQDATLEDVSSARLLPPLAHCWLRQIFLKLADKARAAVHQPETKLDVGQGGDPEGFLISEG
jgi:ATP-binding cassette subfamily A (ABC1) protein 4